MNSNLFTFSFEKNEHAMPYISYVCKHKKKKNREQNKINQPYTV